MDVPTLQRSFWLTLRAHGGCWSRLDHQSVIDLKRQGARPRKFRQRYSRGPRPQKMTDRETLIVLGVSYGYFACNPRRTSYRWPSRLGT
jgi:hypothetical protein